MGIIVALFIFYTGIQIVRDTVGNLLGQAPDPKLVKALETEILSFEGVVGVHDLIVHDYGPNRIFASAHAEVPSNADIMKSHDTIDLIEREIKEKIPHGYGDPHGSDRGGGRASQPPAAATL